VKERQDGLQITPPTTLSPATVQTYDDHRMAMSFAIAGLRLPGVAICDPDCTHKTFPGFFDALEGLKCENESQECSNAERPDCSAS
jgi:3-phosphoshikimate 1-carboxyvinyltransferase